MSALAQYLSLLLNQPIAINAAGVISRTDLKWSFLGGWKLPFRIFSLIFAARDFLRQKRITFQVPKKKQKEYTKLLCIKAYIKMNKENK